MQLTLREFYFKEFEDKEKELKYYMQKADMHKQQVLRNQECIEKDIKNWQDALDKIKELVERKGEG